MLNRLNAGNCDSLEFCTEDGTVCSRFHGTIFRFTASNRVGELRAKFLGFGYTAFISMTQSSPQ